MHFPAGVIKAKRPSFKENAGRGWWECDVVLPDGSKAAGHYEATRGTRFYFQHADQWYVASIERFDTQGPGSVITPDLQNTPAQRRLSHSLNILLKA